MDEKDLTASNFIPNDLLDIICILGRDEKHHLHKIIRNSSKENNFSFIAKCPVKNAESTPLKNNASVVDQQVIRTRNKFLPKASCVIKGESVERKKPSFRASGPKFSSQHTDKKYQEARRTTEAKEESPSSSGKGTY